METCQREQIHKNVKQQSKKENTKTESENTYDLFYCFIFFIDVFLTNDFKCKSLSKHCVMNLIEFIFIFV